MITLEDIEKLLVLIKPEDICEKCNTNKEYIVLGYYGKYCKCEADKLSETKPAKEAQVLIRKLCNIK